VSECTQGATLARAHGNSLDRLPASHLPISG
jgi:hypothetical protein